MERKTEKCGSCHGGGKIRCVGERRQLIAEKRAADDRAGDDAGREAHTETDPHAGEACGCGGAVGCACADGKDGAQDHCRRKENAGADDPETVVDQSRYGAAEDPCTDQTSDCGNDHNGLEARPDPVQSVSFDGMPVTFGDDSINIHDQPRHEKRNDKRETETHADDDLHNNDGHEDQ